MAFKCMLGTQYSPDLKIQWPCLVTEKLDGIRRILIKKDSVCRFYSRTGEEDLWLSDISAEASLLPDNMVYDGELLAIGKFSNSIELRQATASIANRKSEKHGLTFNVFDMLPVSEFESGRSKLIARERKKQLRYTFMRLDLQYIKEVPVICVCENYESAVGVAFNFWGKGGEGVMLNTMTGHYECKRSKELIKVKRVMEVEAQVIGIMGGTGKCEGKLGSLSVEYKGNVVKVGSGFTDEQREEIWNNRESYIGKYIEIETFGESKNQQNDSISLNCPIFKRFKGEYE